jgi:hypothetical protein
MKYKANTTYTKEDAKSAILEMLDTHECIRGDVIVRWMNLQLQLALVPTHLHANYDIKQCLDELSNEGKVIEMIYRKNNAIEFKSVYFRKDLTVIPLFKNKP